MVALAIGVSDQGGVTAWPIPVEQGLDVFGGMGRTLFH